MKFTIEIDCGNAAFEDQPLGEIARILRDVVTRMERFSDDSTWEQALIDTNGNRVGFARTEDE